MLHLLKHKILAYLFTAIISLLLTLLLLFLLPKAEKFKVELADKEVVPSGIYFYQNLDTDTLSEKIEFYKNFDGHSAIIVEKGPELLHQHNYRGKFVNLKFFYFADIEEDVKNEICVMTYKNDSAFLSITEGITGRIIVDEIFVTKFKYHSELPDIRVTQWAYFDCNGDGQQDLFYNLRCNFSYVTRKSGYYDIKNKEIHESPSFGCTLSDKISFHDIDNDGYNEYFGNMLAVGNCPPGYPLTDHNLWFYVMDSRHNMKFEPVKVGAYPGKITTCNISNPEYPGIAALVINMGSSKNDSYLAVFNKKGEMQHKKNISLDKDLNKAVLFTTKDEPCINIFNSNGLLDKYDNKLHLAKQTEHFPFYSKECELDIDLDGNKEWIFKTEDFHLLAATNKLQYPVKLPAQVLGEYFLSVETNKTGSTLLNIQTGNELYKILYKKNQIYPFRYILKLLLYGVIFLIVFFIGLVFQKIATKKLESEKQLAQLQLAAIEKQLNPHFNLNILNSIGGLYETQDKKKAHLYLGKYGKLLRELVMRAGKINVTIEEELDFTRNYLELEKMRMKHSFEYSVTGENAFLELEIPKMLIHTFCENAVKHGLLHLNKKGNIDINFSMEKSILQISIKDNGIGRKKSKQFSLISTGKGLRILNQILNLYFQLKNIKIKYKIEDLKTPETGTTVRIFIPT